MVSSIIYQEVAMQSTPNYMLHKGFTLIELLVVISIIAMLIAILLPALSKARAAAKNTQCLSNLRQVAIAQTAYAADNGRYPVHYAEVVAPTACFWPSQVADNVGPSHDVRPLLEQYISDINFLNCPFLPSVDRSTKAIPPGTLRVYMDYMLVPGFWRDRVNGTWTSDRWTRPGQIWKFNGHTMNVLCGDKLFYDGIGKSSRVNHVGASKGFILSSRSGPSWASSEYVSNTGEDERSDCSGNFAMKDGSAASYRGNDPRLIDVRIEAIASGARVFAMPTSR